MSEWARVPFADAIDFREGPGIMAVDFHGEGVPLLRLAGLTAGAGLLTGCNYLDPVKVETKWSHFRVDLGDVLLSTSASLGRVAVVTEEAVGAVPYTGIIRMRPASDLLLPEFLPWLLRAPDFAAQVEMMGVGSVMAHFGPSHLRKMTVVLPPIEQQRRIAHTLDAFDAVISHKEALARETDELWRVYVRRAAARSGTVAPLSSLASFINGKNFTKGADGKGLPVIRTPEVRHGPTPSTIRNSVNASPDNIVNTGDILFVWSGSLLASRWVWQPGLINQHIFKVVPNVGSPEWLTLWAVEELMDDFLDVAAEKATTMGHIKRADLDRNVALPAQDSWNAIDAVVRPLWDTAIAARVEANELRMVREELMPLLMSGRVRVRELEGLVA